MSTGWIKIHRQLLDWEWYDEPNTLRLFLHLLLKANHKPRNYRGVNIEAGQIMTGYDLLAKQLNLSTQKIRTAIKKLKSTNEITSVSSSQGTIIQIVKYKDYQVVTSKVTDEQQTSNKPITTNKNVKKEKNVNKEVYSFEEFWNDYDKKLGKKSKLETKWDNLSNTDKALIKEHIPKYKLDTIDKQFRKNPETYLNNDSWLDELTTTNRIPKPKAITAADYFDNVR